MQNIDPAQDAKYWSNLSDWANYVYIALGLSVATVSFLVFYFGSRAQAAKDILIATAQQKAEEAKARQEELALKLNKEQQNLQEAIRLRAEAELALRLKVEEIDNARKPRTLTDYQRTILTQSLVNKNKCLVEIHYADMTDEGDRYSKQIIGSIEEAGWETKVTVRVFTANHTGIDLLVEDESNLSDCSKHLVKSFDSAGIHISVKKLSQPLNHGKVALYFGNKPTI